MLEVIRQGIWVIDGSAKAKPIRDKLILHETEEIFVVLDAIDTELEAGTTLEYLMEQMDELKAGVMERMDELEAGVMERIDQLEATDQVPEPPPMPGGYSFENLKAFPPMSRKQHCALQMIFDGATNDEIGERFGTTGNAAKTHIRAIARKLGVSTKVQIIAKLLGPFERISDDAYLTVSRGVPKDWARTYHEAGYSDENPDPIRDFYWVDRSKPDGRFKPQE